MKKALAAMMAVQLADIATTLVIHLGGGIEINLLFWVIIGIVGVQAYVVVLLAFFLSKITAPPLIYLAFKRFGVGAWAMWALAGAAAIPVVTNILDIIL